MVNELINLSGQNPVALISVAVVLFSAALLLCALSLYKLAPTIIARLGRSPAPNDDDEATMPPSSYSDMPRAIARERSQLDQLSQQLGIHELRIHALETAMKRLEPLRESFSDLRVAAEATKVAAEATRDRLEDMCDRLSRIEDHMMAPVTPLHMPRVER